MEEIGTIYNINFFLTDQNFQLLLSDYCLQRKNYKDSKILFTNPSAQAGYDTRSIFFLSGV